MKITKEQLKQIIKEELNEMDDDHLINKDLESRDMSEFDRKDLEKATHGVTQVGKQLDAIASRLDKGQLENKQVSNALRHLAKMLQKIIAGLK